jgi:WD40 repeat protein
MGVQSRSEGLEGTAIALAQGGRILATLQISPPSVIIRDDSFGLRHVDLQQAKGTSAYSLAFSPDGALIYCGLDKHIRIITLVRPANPPKYWAAHHGAVMGLAVLGDGHSLLSAGTDGHTKHWSSDGRLIRLLDWQIGELGAIAVAPDGLTAAVGGAERIVIWDVE